MPPLIDLTGKVAVVTGGSGRLGPIWVDVLEEAGAKVYVLDLPDTDVSKLDQIAAFKEFVIDEGGGEPPTIVVNSAAIDNPPGTKASFFGNAERILEVNLMGVVNVTKVFLPGMIRAGGGVFVSIGSIMGSIGADYRNYPISEDGTPWEKPVAYNLSKAALVQLSRSITTQYGRYNVRGVTISFGPFDVGLSEEFKEKFLRNVPLNRMISEESVRAALMFAVTCPEFAGQQVLIDGGYCAW